MAWPPITHQDVYDEVVRLRALVEGGATPPPAEVIPTVTASGLLADFVAHEAVASEGTVTAWANRVSGGPAMAIFGNPQKVTTDASGKASIIFDGVDDRADCALPLKARPFTRVIIGRIITVVAGKTLIGTTNGTTNRAVIATASSGGVWNLYGGANIASSVAYDSNKHLLAAVYAGTNASSITVDGTVTTGTGGTESGEGLRLAANMGLTQFAHMECFRALAYDRALSAAEIATIRTDHQAYYGLP